MLQALAGLAGTAGMAAGSGAGSSTNTDIFTMRDFKGGSFNPPPSLLTAAGYVALGIGTVYALKKLKIWK